MFTCSLFNIKHMIFFLGGGGESFLSYDLCLHMYVCTVISFCIYVPIFFSYLQYKLLKICFDMKQKKHY